MSETAASLTAASDAVARGEWPTALEALAQAETTKATQAEWLELSGRAAYGAGQLERAVAAYEELHRLHLHHGRSQDAALAAATVAMYLMMDTGLMAPVRAWLQRAERLLDGDGENGVSGLVAMVRAYERFLCGDMAAAGTWAEQAIDLGLRHGAPPAVALGRVAAARVQILQGDLDDGLAALDEVALVLLSGELDNLTAGMVWCELICAMQGLALYDQAEEWTVAMERWRQGAAFGGINGRCRVHRAEILRLRGSCEEAEREALRACDELRPWMRREFGWPLTELGTIRLRKGDLAGAEEAFLAAHANAWDPEPGLARLRLAQGDGAAATALIHRALERPPDIPSKERPPFGPLRRAPLLEAQAEIAAVTGDTAAAIAAADELRTIAETFPSAALKATAALASARAAFTSGDAGSAVALAEAAVAGWSEIRAPYEAAVARILLGQAHRDTGDTTSAVLEWHAARSTLNRLGSHLHREQVDALLGERGSVSTAPRVRPSSGSATFRCEGDTRSITFDGRTVLVRDLKGLRYLARLLAEPNREFHVLDLVAAENRQPPTRPATSEVQQMHLAGDAGPLLDHEARDAYRRRLSDIEDDIAEATERNDLARIALAQADRDYLLGELVRAFGLDGRTRRSGSPSERARSSVTRSLRYALDRIAQHHEPLAAHLRQTVRTGTYCIYAPDPRVPIDWEV